VRRDDMTYVSSALRTLSVFCRKTYCLCRLLRWNLKDWNVYLSRLPGTKSSH